MPTTDYIWEVTTPDTNLHKLKDAEAMRFKGTLGIGGTITTLPSASASNRGDSYKVITDGTYASQEAHVGDWFTSDGSAWQLFTGSGGSGTTYTFEDGVNSFTVTPDGGTAQTVNVTPSIADATTSVSGLMSASDKTKLNGIAIGAEVNQNAFSNVKVGNTTIQADSKTDTLELVAGSNVTITPDDTNDKVTISATDTNTTYSLTQDSSDGHKITLTPSSGTAQTLTIPDNNTTYTIATGDNNGQIKVTPSSGNAYSVSVKGLGSAAYKNATDSYSATGTDVVTGKAVAAALDTLPEPMVFKGSLGTGGTITTLPVDGSASVGDTYKVITDGTYASQAAKVGDTFICDSKTSLLNTWVLIPSGDEPSGTVTSVAVSNGGGLSVSGSPITTSGTITISHSDTSSQASVSNTGRTYIQSVTLDTYGHVTGLSSATETVTNTHRPIQVNGTQNLGDNTTPLNLKNGTNITVTADGGNVTIATSAEVNQNAFSNVKVGSTTVAADSKTDTLELVAGSNVTLTPDATNDKITIAATDTNTHRPIQVNGTEILGNNTTALNLKAGSNVSVTNSSGTVTIAATDTTYTAGTGLKLSGTQFLTNVPRIGNGDLNYKPGVNTFNIQEYSNGSTNVPEAEWQHTLTIEGSDSNYTTQLSLGMTNVPSAYYRRMDSNNYSEWYRLTNALLQRYETGTITNGTWYRLFTINYTSYSYLHLRVLVKAGYNNLYEAFICVRYTPNGMDGEYTSIRIIGSQPTTKNLVLYKTSDTAIALAVCCDGANSTMGFEIHDMHNESNTIKAENVSVENPFVALSARPTTFGKHYYLTGDYSDLVNKPALNYLPLSGGTMTGIITAKASVYEDSYSGALNMNNSNIYRLNSIYTADTADTAAEGIHFYRDATHVDTLWMNGGDLLFVPNRALGTSTSKADSQKVGRFTANPTSGQVVITDGTTGGIKSSGYTIAASVPSGAKFTDTTYTFAGGTNSFTVTPSGGSAQTVSITVSDSTKLPLTGGSLTGGLEIKGVIAGDSGSTGHGLWGGGGYHNAYNNILLHGDKLTGTSGIAFVSDKSDNGTITTINQPSDRAFIQYHAYGISTATAESTNPTLATTGEAGRFVIGVGNDSTDQLWLQTPARTGLIHQVGATSYVIPDTNNTSGTVGSATQPVFVDGGAIKGCTYSLNATVPSGAVFTDTTYTFAGGTNQFTVTPAGGSAQTVTVTPSITNNITGSGTSGYIAKFNGTNTITNGPAFGSATTTYLRNDGTWATPPNDNTDTKVTQTATSTNANYEVLFSATADNTTRTETARKNSNLLFNPSTGVLYGMTEVRSTNLSISATNGTSGGISLYSNSSNMDNYGIYFRQTSNKEKHGYVQGDWATYFTMNDQDNRGWVFRRNKTTGNVASIDTKGNVVANGSVTVGGNAANTSGCRMVYDSTNECMNLEFAS